MQTLLAFVIASTSVTQSGALGAIQAADKTLSAAVAKKDVAAILALYAEDAEMIPPDQDPAKGKGAIESLWRGVVDAGVVLFELKIDDVKSDGDTADEKGGYTMKLASGEIFQRGKYHSVWKKDNGVWKLRRNDWTIDPA